jgi:hypothetical protein
MTRMRLWPARLRALGGWDAASVALGLTVSVVMLATLRSYGLTHDEPNHIDYGEYVFEYFRSGGTDQRALEFSRYYGAGFDLFAAVIRRVVPLDAVDATHLACVTVGLIGYVGVWWLGRLLVGPVAGFWALVALLLTPVYYGHQFNNMKDAPFAAGYVWAIAFAVQLVRNLPRPGVSRWALFALGLGLSACTRIGGLILVPILMVVIALVAVHRLRLGVGLRAVAGEALGQGWRGAISVAAAWVVMVLPWPWAHESPIANPLAAAGRFARYAAYDSPTLLGGRSIPAKEVPWDYLPTYLMLQVPEWTTLAAASTVVVVAIGAARALSRGAHLPASCLLVLLSCAVPPAVAILKGATIYDGLRHFLFILPPIAALAGVAVAGALQWVRQYGALPHGSVVLALTIASADGVTTMRRLHPYQHVGFNRLAGGLPRAVERYESEYYGTTYRELLAWLSRYVWERDGAKALETTYKVTGCGTNMFFNVGLPPNFRFISRRDARKADFYATYRRFDCHSAHGRYPVIHRVERDGAVLALIRDMAAPPKKVKPKKPSKRSRAERGRGTDARDVGQQEAGR